MARDQGVDTMNPGVWAEMMRINVTGAGLMIRESLRALTRRTAQAWGQKNIRANAVAHGVVLTQKFPCRPCASGLPCGCRRDTQRFGRGHRLHHPRRCLIPVSLRNIKVPFVAFVALLHSGLRQLKELTASLAAIDYKIGLDQERPSA
ncbi:hypothetical protein ACFRFU_09665 [Streptomyces sp. NPDC056704]|uniref:hypothetical protein n=1 Tax=Streptomyces TaxID=1883 RepID=UPI0036960FFE